MHHIGYYSASYKSLYETFGPPENGDGIMVSTKWVIIIPGGYKEKHFRATTRTLIYYQKLRIFNYINLRHTDI